MQLCNSSLLKPVKCSVAVNYYVVAQHVSINHSTKLQTRNQGRDKYSPEKFKTLHSNFDICSNIQRMKMKIYILITF